MRFNIRFRGSGSDDALKPLIAETQLYGRYKFTGAGYKVDRQTITWVSDWNNGRISLALSREDQDDVLGVNFNFERGKADFSRAKENRAEILEWLNQPVPDLEEQVKTISSAVLGLPSGVFA